MKNDVKIFRWVLSIAFFFVLACGQTVLWADSGLLHQETQTRPIELGTSGGNVNDRSSIYCCSGTLGALVEDGNGIRYILSNNHVLARNNQAAIGEEINQPGMIDQQCGQSGIVAQLSDFVPILYSKGRTVKLNEVDAAIAQIRDGFIDPTGSIIDIGPISDNTVSAYVGQLVQKSGRTTGHTSGSISAVDVTVDIGYSKDCGSAANNIARFVNQLRITPGTFSAGGDSGALIVESGTVDPQNGLPRAVGLLFAGSSSSTIASPIAPVLAQLGVTMVGGGSTLIPLGSISGQIIDNQGNALSGASVDADTGQSTSTGVGGNYILDNVPAGDRTVTASATGFQASPQGVVVTEGNQSTADFALTPVTLATSSLVPCVTYASTGGKDNDRHLLITLGVEDELGNPVPGAQADISVTLDGSFYADGTGAITDSQGLVSYNAKNASNGKYATTVTAVIKDGLSFSGIFPVNAWTKGIDPNPDSFCLDGTSPQSDNATRQKALQSLDTVREIKSRHSNELLSIPGIIGHGISRSADGRPVIEIYLENENAETRARIPSNLENVPVRVLVTGPFTAF
ncbi:carboxypeptidase regulatory-like domain-containing protein [Desulfopila aestuarii]|uniref:Carboxypeptidase regulatory-like domain-containing protein n=1 Tax=Desulfopila aestuarii DSM 18488 TaxID=1121416 RepID=A0A1M7YA53_9BACT|nr:carboxypeptidase regulatory-like domain-containing protein [Desulfopila aestuarii]SHO49500.1 Carboxypeptidase regulatory-like domain-containing protein [Desulfopila aestuarii DSM 18488]